MAIVGTRTRKAGGGRKRVTDLDPTLLRDLDALVEPTAPGDPDSPLRWTCLSARTLAVALDALGHHVSQRWSRSCCTASASLGGRPRKVLAG